MAHLQARGTRILLATLLGLTLGLLSARAHAAPPAPSAVPGRPAAAPIVRAAPAPNSGSPMWQEAPRAANSPTAAAAPVGATTDGAGSAVAAPASPVPAASPGADWQTQDQQQQQQLEALQRQAQQQMLQKLGLPANLTNANGEAANKIQRYLAVVMDPKFVAAVTAARENPNRILVVYCEVGWFLVLLVFRSWRASHLTHWYQRLWLRLWTGAVFAAGSALVIPSVILGAPYIEAARLLVNGVVGTSF